MRRPLRFQASPLKPRTQFRVPRGRNHAMNTKMATATGANAVTGFHIGRSALIALLLSSAAPAFAQTAPQPADTTAAQIQMLEQQVQAMQSQIDSLKAGLVKA